MQKLLNRMRAPVPVFFKKIRNIGLTLVAVGTALVAGPAALPVILVKIAGYLIASGGAMAAVSQATSKYIDH